MRKGLMRAVVLLLLAFSSTINAETTNGDVNLSRLSEEVRAIAEDQLPKAEEILYAVLATAPGDADALNLLGVVRA